MTIKIKNLVIHFLLIFLSLSLTLFAKPKWQISNESPDRGKWGEFQEIRISAASHYKETIVAAGIVYNRDVIEEARKVEEAPSSNVFSPSDWVHITRSDDIVNIAVWDSERPMWVGIGLANNCDQPSWGTTAIYDMITYTDSETGKEYLVVAGNFNCIDNVAAKNIARYDGEKWEPLGDGLKETIYSLVMYNDTIVTGHAVPPRYSDHDDEISFEPIDLVNMWDKKESTWTTIKRAHGDVNDMVVYNNKLVIGADFGVQIWNGPDKELEEICQESEVPWLDDNWEILAKDIDVNALAVFENPATKNKDLIVGGKFETKDLFDGAAKVLNAKNIVKWDGEKWVYFWGETSREVYSLAVSDNKLFIGGNFKKVDGLVAFEIEVNGISEWDGRAFKKVGSGVHGVAQFRDSTIGEKVNFSGHIPVVHTIVPFNEKLIIAGYFDNFLGEFSAGIAVIEKTE